MYKNGVPNRLHLTDTSKYIRFFNVTNFSVRSTNRGEIDGYGETISKDLFLTTTP